VFNIHSPQLQTCLREPGKAFLITIVFAKVKKTKTKTKKPQKSKEKKNHSLASTSSPQE
jgi:arginine exporter protein ArgO